jgi:hypothetical protein
MCHQNSLYLRYLEQSGEIRDFYVITAQLSEISVGALDELRPT